MEDIRKYKLADYIDSFGDGIHGTPNYDENGEYYFINGRRHSKNKPAFTEYREDGSKSREEYYLNGEFVMTGKEVEKYINSTKPIKVRTINKLKILYNVCEARNLENKVEELGRKLLLKTL